MIVHKVLPTLISLVWLSKGIHATIRVESTGQTYTSRLDDTLGPRLAEHEVYKARLQQLEGNAHLCYPPSESVKWDITLPNDGMAGKCELGAAHRF